MRNWYTYFWQNSQLPYNRNKGPFAWKTPPASPPSPSPRTQKSIFVGPPPTIYIHATNWQHLIYSAMSGDCNALLTQAFLVLEQRLCIVWSQAFNGERRECGGKTRKTGLEFAKYLRIFHCYKLLIIVNLWICANTNPTTGLVYQLASQTVSSDFIVRSVFCVVLHGSSSCASAAPFHTFFVSHKLCNDRGGYFVIIVWNT